MSSVCVQPSKWDLILEQKPIPLLRHLLTEAAKLSAADLAVGLRMKTSIQTGAEWLTGWRRHRPDPRLYREAFLLTRFDLTGAERSDDYLRNQRWMDRARG